MSVDPSLGTKAVSRIRIFDRKNAEHTKAEIDAAGRSERSMAWIQIDVGAQLDQQSRAIRSARPMSAFVYFAFLRWKIRI
jgi:hypothetical protein